MSTNIGNLKVSIGADTADLARGIGRAKAHIRSFSKVAKVGALAAGAVFTAASVGMVAMSRSGLAFVDAQAKMARMVDGSIDGLRALQIATADAGVATDVINKSVETMGKRLAEAARDGFGPAHEALELLNLSASDLMKMDVDERFGAIADRVKDLGLSAQQAGDLMRQFGVRNGEVAVALLQGSAAIRAARQEVDAFGLSIGEDAAAAVERANDAMSRIGFVFEGLGNQLAVTIAPALESVAIKFQGMAQEGGPLQAAIEGLATSFGSLISALLDPAFVNAAIVIGGNLAGAVTKLAGVMVFLVDNAELAGAAMVALGGAMVWFTGPIGLAVAAVAGGVALLTSNLGENATAADTATEAEKRLQAALDLVDTSNEAAVESGGRLINTHIDTARAALEAAKAELTLARSKQAAGSALLDQNPLTADGNSGYAAAMAANTAAAEVQLAAAEAQLERYQTTLEGFKRSQYPSQGTGAHTGAGSGEDPVTPGSGGGAVSTAQFTKELDALIDRLDPAAAKTRDLAHDHATLAAALIKGTITVEEYDRHFAALKKLYADTPEATSAATAGIKALNSELSKSPAEAMADDVNGAIGNLISSIGSGTNVLRDFGLELVKIFAVRGISKLLGGDDWLTGSLFGANALGTDNWRGGLSWVGEKGPELVNLPRGAQVIPNNKIGQMGGSGGGGFTYAPVIDARGASLSAVQELDQRMRADGAQFNQKVIAAVRSGQSKRML